MSVTMRLFRKEMKMFGLSYLLSVLFFILYSLFFYVIIEDALSGDRMAMHLLDFVLLFFAQVFGLGFTKFNFTNPFRQDPYTKKVRVLRRMPISCTDIVNARYLQMLVVAVVNTLAFLLPAYMLSSAAQQMIAWPEFLTFCYMIYCFSVAMGSFYVYLELGYSGKRYFLICLMAIILSILLLVLLVVSHSPLTVWLLQQAVAGYGIMSCIAAAIITCGLASLFMHLSNRRLMRRDYI